MKNILKIFIFLLLAFTFIFANTITAFALDNKKGDSFYISEDDINSVKKAYEASTLETFTGKIFFKVFHEYVWTLREQQSFRELSLKGNTSYLFYSGANTDHICLHSDGRKNYLVEDERYTKEFLLIYEKAKNGKELMLSAENLGLDNTLEISETYCFYPPTGPGLHYWGIGFETNFGTFIYYKAPGTSKYDFLLPMDVFKKAADIEQELFPPDAVGFPSHIGTNYDLSEYALGDYSPPKAPEPEQKFNLLHLIWIIPSSLAILGGGAFISVYLIKKKRKEQENT